MEGVAAAASIGALVDMAVRAYKIIFKYTSAVKNARKDVEQLIAEVLALSGVLHSLKIFASALEAEDTGEERAFRAQHVDSCYHTLSQIRSDLEKAQADFESSNKLKGLQRRLRWPFGEDETLKMLERIGNHKQTMSLAMTADSMGALIRKLNRHHEDGDRRMAEVQSDVRRTLEITMRVDINTARRQVLGFFTRAESDPQRDSFETSVSRRFHLTGVWLTEGEQFQRWLNVPRSRLWLAGIPGAGKTVLAGAMIEEALTLSSPTCAVAFFFCDSSKGVTATLTEMLGTLATQLARQSDDAFAILDQYYTEVNPQQGHARVATAKRLAEVLSEMVDVFDRTYIIVDGLDEYGDEATDFIEALNGIWESTEACSLALLSRDEYLIQEILEDDYEYVKAEARKDDIERYVTAKIEEWVSQKGRRTKRKISDSIRETIIQTLVDKADGMFRWVACQIDYLCGQFASDRERLDALQDLPPDLGKTYERILDRVNQRGSSIQKLVQRVLCLIAFGEVPITISELREAVSPYIANPEDLVSEDEIALRCSSLIRKSNNGGRFEFAHFTVREFLQSKALLGTKYEQYHIASGKVSVALASISIRFLLRDEFSDQTRDSEAAANQALQRASKHPFYSYAARYWTSNSDNTWWEDDETRRLAFELFGHPKTGNFTNWAIEVCRHFLSDGRWYRLLGKDSPNVYEKGRKTIFEGLVGRVSRADFTPLHLASALGIPWVCEHLISQGVAVNSNSLVGIPLHCAVAGPLVFFDGDVLSRAATGGMVDVRVFDRSARLSTLKALLKAGANHTDICHTAFWAFPPLCVSLKLGLETANYTLFLELLRAGAPVDRKTCALALDIFQTNVASFPNNVDGLEGFEAFSAALEGILDATASRSQDQGDESRTLRAAALQFVSIVKTQFTWGSSIKFNLGSASTDKEQMLQEAKLAVKFGDVDAVRQLLSGASAEVVLKERFEEGKTLLHYSVEHSSLEVMKALIDAGFDVNLPDYDGWNAVMYCVFNRHTPILRELLGRGGRVDMADKAGATLWHQATYRDSPEILEMLLEACSDTKIQALAQLDSKGNTPLACGLLGGAVSASILVLSQIKGMSECFASELPLYRIAAANTTSTDLLTAMAEAGVPPDPVGDDGDTPLHYLDSRNHPAFVSMLKRLYPNAGRRTTDGRTPLELMLSEMLKEISLDAGWETLKELVREGQDEQVEGVEKQAKSEEGEDEKQTPPRPPNPTTEARKLWPFLGNIIPSDIRCDQEERYCDRCVGHVNSVCNFLIDQGALDEFEDTHGSSGLIPLLSCFRDAGGNYMWNLLPGCLVTVMRVIEETKHWASIKDDPLILELMSTVIGIGLDLVVIYLLSKGVDVHASVNGSSAIEQACMPGRDIELETFAAILDHCDLTKLNSMENHTTGSRSKRASLIHLVGLGNVRDAPEKLEMLINKGADVNARMFQKRIPALVFHLGQGSFETAQALLEAGADPNLQDDDGWDALLMAVRFRNVGFLREVEQRSSRYPSPINWQHTCTIQLDDDAIHGCNALHVGALFSSGDLECLQFYLNGGYISDMNPTTTEGFHYLHLAAKVDDEGAIRLLSSQQSRAMINEPTQDGRSALEIAVMEGSLDAVRALLDLGAEQMPDDAGITPALLALIGEHHDILVILETSQGGTAALSNEQARREAHSLGTRHALEKAIEEGRIGICEPLRGMRCPLDQPLLQCGGCSPLIFALRKDRMDIAEWMLNTGADVKILESSCPDCSGPNGYCKSAVDIAASLPGRAQLLPRLLTEYMRHGGLPFLEDATPLHFAALAGSAEGIRAIVTHVEENVGWYR